MHLDEVWQVVEKSQAQNVSMYKVAMLSADGASAGSCLYWQQKLNAMYYKRSRMSLLSLEPVRISVCTDASVHSCRDTLISIFYSCQNDISCYGISQHLWPGKIVSAGDEVAVETEEMERLLARREQSRLATYKLAKLSASSFNFKSAWFSMTLQFLKKFCPWWLQAMRKIARLPWMATSQSMGLMTLTSSRPLMMSQCYACWWTKPVLTWPWPHFWMIPSSSYTWTMTSSLGWPEIRS